MHADQIDVIKLDWCWLVIWTREDKQRQLIFQTKEGLCEWLKLMQR